jgi:hypothetical protein
MSEVMARLLAPHEWKRGPGGNWFKWMATDGVTRGYGQTEMEARRDLKARIEGQPEVRGTT